MSSTTSTTSTTTAPSKTWKDYFQYWIYFLRVFTILTLIMNLVAYAVVIKIGVTSDFNDVLQKTFIVLQNVGFGLFVICLIIAEFQPVWFVKRVMILHYWAGRGFGQAFMGVQLIASAANAGAAVAHDTGGNSKALQTFAEVSGWILFSIGLVMIIMSALCLRDIVKLKADQQLEAALLSDKSGGTSVVIHQQKVSQGEVFGNDAKDKLQKEVENYQTLVQNMSTALGISYVVASSKFGGKSGAQAAENFQREMKQKEEQLKKSASALGNSAKQEFNKASAAVESTVSSYSPKGDESSSGGTSSNVNIPNSTSGSYSNNNNQQEDEPVGRRKRAQMDDDELERMYYGK